ncbi:MAG: dihydrofolate reductase family protein [Chitinophagaceae bacterium]|nr:dihydrofolate reductase family protein [Chitinophagaceae bacterium]
MRKIIVTEFITLDGVIEAPGGNETDHPHGGWQAQYRSPEGGQYKSDELNSVEALLLGRNTYELFAGYWPGQTGNPFSDRMNGLPKYIVSTSLNEAVWNNSHILRDANKVAELKKGEGGDILVYGSAALVKSLLHHNLVDELHLMVIPVSVGGGLRLFEDNRELKRFGLKHSRTFGNGVMVVEYQLPVTDSVDLK